MVGWSRAAKERGECLWPMGLQHNSYVSDVELSFPTPGVKQSGSP